MDSSISHDPKAPDGPSGYVPQVAEPHPAMQTSGPVTGTGPEPDADESPLEASESAADAGPGTDTTDPEQAAARGTWDPAEQGLDFDGTSLPCWNLVGGWVGTLVGDEVNGVHLVAPDRAALVEKVRTEIATTEATLDAAP